jgi:hypothetical protein
MLRTSQGVTLERSFPMPVHSTKLPRVCETCGVTFMAFPSAVRRGGGRYCSHPCYAARPIEKAPLADRFWSKVDTDGECWLWTGALNRCGYGEVRAFAKKQSAHRVAWEITNGSIPEAQHVLHRCDTPACVNPDHLFLGSHTDNMRDMSRKGRSGPTNHPERMARGDRNGARLYPERMPRGEQNSSSKLTWKQVREIRARWAAGGVHKAALAREYGISHSNLNFIILNKTWTENDGGLEVVEVPHE